eukprot:4702976-Alexandrium_andersonii.AAC.1
MRLFGRGPGGGGAAAACREDRRKPLEWGGFRRTGTHVQWLLKARGAVWSSFERSPASPKRNCS